MSDLPQPARQSRLYEGCLGTIMHLPTHVVVTTMLDRLLVHIDMSPYVSFAAACVNLLEFFILSMFSTQGKLCGHFSCRGNGRHPDTT